MTERTIVAEFADRWEAELARHRLAQAGIEAWVEEAGSKRTAERLRLLVPESEAQVARAVLVEAVGDGEEADRTAGRPMWMPVVAALVVIGMVWGAVPSFLWPWIILVGLVGFLLWRAAGPRRPRG